MLIWSPAALTDLGEAWLYIASDNERAADRVRAAIEHAAKRVEQFPRMGRPSKLAGSREFSVPNTRYFLVYQLRTDHIDILRVMHSSRQWPPKG